MCPLVSMSCLISVLSKQLPGKGEQAGESAYFLSTFGGELMLCFLPGCSKDGLIGKIDIPNHSTSLKPAITRACLLPARSMEKKPGRIVSTDLQSSWSCFWAIALLALVWFSPPDNYWTWWAVYAKSRVFNHRIFLLFWKISSWLLNRGMNYCKKRCIRTPVGIYTSGLAMTQLLYMYHHHSHGQTSGTYSLAVQGTKRRDICVCSSESYSKVSKGTNAEA